MDSISICSKCKKEKPNDDSCFCKKCWGKIKIKSIPDKPDMNYNFVNYKEIGYMGLRLSYSHLGLLQRFYDLIDKPETIDILIDIENKVIALDISGKTFKISHTDKHYHRINTRKLSQKMPQGRYIFKEKKDNKFICLLDLKTKKVNN